MRYCVDTHNHTLASSHAYSTLHDYVAVAVEKGIRLFAITDHGPAMPDAPHPWHFINMRLWPRLIQGIGILRGIEANIVDESGAIDLDDKHLGGLDLVMAGFHEPVFAPKDRETNTQALVNCISSGRVDIISHPGNPKFPLDLQSVVEAAAKDQVALEINNSSFEFSRPGSENNCMKVVELARDYGAYLTFGSDSHLAFTLGDFEHCEALVRQVGFPKERLLVSSPRALLDFLHHRGHSSIPEFADF